MDKKCEIREEIQAVQAGSCLIASERDGDVTLVRNGDVCGSIDGLEVNVDDRRGIVDQVFMDIACAGGRSGDVLTLKAEISRRPMLGNSGQVRMELCPDQLTLKIRKEGDKYFLVSEVAISLSAGLGLMGLAH